MKFITLKTLVVNDIPEVDLGGPLGQLGQRQPVPVGHHPVQRDDLPLHLLLGDVAGHERLHALPLEGAGRGRGGGAAPVGGGVAGGVKEGGLGAGGGKAEAAAALGGQGSSGGRHLKQNRIFSFF